MTPHELTDLIKNEAYASGFDHCGITPAEELHPERERFASWLKKGGHAGMDFMIRNTDRRTNPSELFPGAMSVAVVSLNYYPGNYAAGECKLRIARYASGKDYHIVVKDKLSQMLDALKTVVPGLEGRVFVDSAPLMEKALAVRAGIGSQGRNTLLIVRDSGSYSFLGELVINMEAEYDRPASSDPCGTCRRCIEACPTGALSDKGYLDASRCISYLTVEHQGEIPAEYPGRLGSYIFGCDICQEVCPYNKEHAGHCTPEFDRSPARIEIEQRGWATINPDIFDAVFKGTAVERCGYENFIRNLSVASG